MDGHNDHVDASRLATFPPLPLALCTLSPAVSAEAIYGRGRRANDGRQPTMVWPPLHDGIRPSRSSRNSPESLTLSYHMEYTRRHHPYEAPCIRKNVTVGMVKSHERRSVDAR